MDTKLRALCRLSGLILSFTDLWGSKKHLSEQAALALKSGESVEEELKKRRTGTLPACAVLWEGDRKVLVRSFNSNDFKLEAELENGEKKLLQFTKTLVRDYGYVKRYSLEIKADFPVGYHKVKVTGSSEEMHLLCAPQACYQPIKKPAWGISAQIYSLRDERQLASGDFTSLKKLMKICGEAGGSLVGINPVHFPYKYSDSPYSPASKIFYNPLYVTTGESPNDSGDLVDYRAAYDVKYAALEKLYQKEKTTRRFKDYKKARAEDLELFFEDDFSKFLQWKTEEELSELAANPYVGLYFDIAVGVGPDSADVRCYGEVFNKKLKIGAPPDDYNKEGQDWGFCALDPEKLRETGYLYFRKVLRSSMKYARAVRMDHAMALKRLYCIPAGLGAKDGAYIRYNFEEMLAVLCIESVRNKCLVVGEDLGTVPFGFREEMKKRAMLSYKVMLFEREGNGEFTMPEHYPELALVTPTTHDLPPLACWWSGEEIDIRHDIGMEPEPEKLRGWRHYEKERLLNALDRAGLKPELSPESALDEETLVEVVNFLKRSPCKLLMLPFEDLSLEQRLINIPGVSTEYPCWRIRSKVLIKSLKNRLQKISR